MCTVTYMPTTENGFILTSNRDEKLVRAAATIPVTEIIEGKKILFPRDPAAGGTWIAASRERVLCLLNGAFVKHAVNPPYKKSRGLVVLDCFGFYTVHDFLSKYDFKGIEPFTLIVWSAEEFCEIRWDSKNIHCKKLDKLQSQIWSSATLYSDEVIEKRKSWFQKWTVEKPFPSLQEIRKFHRFTGDGDVNNDLIMNRGGKMLTVSMTSIVKTSEAIEVIYEDLIRQENSTSVLI